jgi:hypothetical protein
MMYMLNHGAQYMIYAPYIQRIVNFKTKMEFGYDGKHGAYQPHIVRAPTIPPSPPTVAIVGTFAAAHGSSPVASPAGARAPPASGHAPSATPKSSKVVTHRGKKQNILVKGLKTLISMCRSNDALICESHQ